MIRVSNFQIGSTHNASVDIAIDLFLRTLWIVWIIPAEVCESKVGAYRTKPGFIGQQMVVMKLLYCSDGGGTAQ